MMNLKKYFSSFIILAILVLSFFLYSSNFYPLLNSDDALNILMAHYYKLPHDLYCWGQDRGGTLIPLISQIFIRLFNISALTSVSISNYIMLIIGYICFASLLKSSYSKIVFSFIWFLPFQRFIDLLRFPIGVEYSLIAVMILLFNKLDFTSKAYSVKNHFVLVAIVLLSIIAVWVSDLAIVTICLLFLIPFIIYNINRWGGGIFISWFSYM